MKHRIPLFAAAAVAMVFSIGATQAAEVNKLQVEKKQPFGQYLADNEGRALYLFTPDTKQTSACYDTCAAAWPPAITGGSVQADSNIKKDLVGTLNRKDGETQLTYGGHPLYYYVKDKGPGATTGQDIKEFGGEWYLVEPNGNKVSGKS